MEQPRDVTTPLSVKSLLQRLLPHSKKWRTIGTSLGVDIQAVIKRVSGNDEDNLNAVLDEWLKKENEPSWPKFCKALERAGLKDLAKVYIEMVKCNLDICTCTYLYMYYTGYSFCVVNFYEWILTGILLYGHFVHGYTSPTWIYII